MLRKEEEEEEEEEEYKEKGGELNFLCGCTNFGGCSVFQLRSACPLITEDECSGWYLSMDSYDYIVLVNEVKIAILDYQDSKFNKS